MEKKSFDSIGALRDFVAQWLMQIRYSSPATGAARGFGAGGAATFTRRDDVRT